MRILSLAALVMTCILSACTGDRKSPSSSASIRENSIAAFLQNAERQSETDQQRRQIQRVLADLLNKSTIELRGMRYADYAGRQNAWSAIQVLQHYFVPNPPASLDENRFFDEVGVPAARTAIKHQLDEVNRALK